MKKFLKVKLGLCALVVVATMACMAASGGCNSVLHNEAEAAAGIAATLNTAATINHNDAFETPAEKLMIANDIMQVATANDNFIAAISAAEAAGGKANTAAITAAFQALVNTVNNLNQGGILQLRSTQAQADFQLVMASIQGALNGMEALAPTAPTSQNAPPGRKRSKLPLMALTLTPEEAEELIALVVAAGSALIPKIKSLRGQDDAELLAGAQADDASAEAIAESDGAVKPAS